MMGKVEDDREIRGVNTGISYLQRALQATLTIWLSQVVIIIAAFGLSESLRIAGVDRDENVLITFLVVLGLIVLTLWLLPRSFLTLKEERQNDTRQRYIQRVLFALSVIWVALAAIIIVAIALYAALRAAGVVKENVNLLITFIVSLGLILLVLRFLPRSFLILKEEK